MTNYFVSRNLGFTKMTIEGIRINALTRHVVIDITTSAPKKRRGAKLDRVSTRNPIMTEMALITMPRPVVVRVFNVAA